MSGNLTYEKYDKKRLAIYGDREKYGYILNNIGARWNPKMTTKPGWNLPVEKEEDLKKLISEFNKEDLLRNIENEKVVSRKTQERYHRGVSGKSEEKHFPEPEPVVPVINCSRKKPQKEKRVEKNIEKKSNRVTDYYRTFKTRIPKDESSDSEVDSSSEEDSPRENVSSPSDSSDDDFPSDTRIKKGNKKEEYANTLKKIKELQNKLESLKKFK